MSWYLKVLKQYADFTGRARRKEYWMFVLFNFIALFIVISLDNLCHLTFAKDIPYGIIFFLYTFAIIVPGLAVTVRRLHDTGHNAWWFLITLIPFVGSIWLLVFMLTAGKPGVNQYGVNPKEVEGFKEKDQAKGAAATLIIAASIWIASSVLDILILAQYGAYSKPNLFIALFNNLIYLTPLALLMLGILMLVKDSKKAVAAFILIIAAVIEIFLKVNGLIHVGFGYINFTMAVNILMIAYPVALLVLGLSMLQINGKGIIKPKAAAICLLVAGLIWVVSVVCNQISTLRYGSNSGIESLQFLAQFLKIIIGISFIVLARSLLQNKENIAEEDERVLICKEEVRLLNVDKKSKIRIGFVVVNIVAGVILFMSGTMFFFLEKEDREFGLIPLCIGLFLWITGAYGLYFRKRYRDQENRTKNVGMLNLICFIISCTIFAFVISLPIIVSMVD